MRTPRAREHKRNAASGRCPVKDPVGQCKNETGRSGSSRCCQIPVRTPGRDAWFAGEKACVVDCRMSKEMMIIFVSIVGEVG